MAGGLNHVTENQMRLTGKASSVGRKRGTAVHAGMEACLKPVIQTAIRPWAEGVQMNQRREAQPTVLAMCLMQMSGINAGTEDSGFYFLENDGQRLHIFRDKEGHFCDDTPENRQRLIDLASDVTKFCGADKWGNCWNAANDNKGRQLWVRYRGRRIEEGGINPKPRIWDPDTGLSNNPFSRK